jgi:anti-sigma factor RsiW
MSVPALVLDFTCDDAERAIGPFVDGELSSDDRTSLLLHTAACPTCARRLSHTTALKSALGQLRDTTPAPLALLAAIRTDLSDEVALRAQQPQPRRPLALVLGLAVGALAIAGVVLVVTHARGGPHATLIAASVERHKSTLPVDVASSDPVRVEDFMRTHLGRTLAVPRLQRAGFDLLGGRVVDVTGHTAVQLRYLGALGHRVSVLALPDPDGTLARSVVDVDNNAPGQAVHLWADGDAVYTVTGDVDDGVLQALAH